MDKHSVLDRNLLPLSSRQPALSKKIEYAGTSPDVSFIKSKNGLIVPVITRNGRPYLMHSKFDPDSEGRKIAVNAPDGYIIAFGLGGAYHLMHLLKKTITTGLIIVEKDIRIIRSILEKIDLSGLFSDSRVLLLADPEPNELSELLLERYLPVLYGNLGSVVLQNRWNADREWFIKTAESLKSIPEKLGRDYTVQSRFGRRWFVNTLLNLPSASGGNIILPPVKQLVICAAGPSLENQIEKIKQLQKNGASVLATDTSLPLLLEENIKPQMVLSIDCQLISYHHFMKKIPEETILILDLASPPVITRRHDKILFFSSGHPFSLYLNQLYKPFPIMDMSGGNVTHAAMSLAGNLGAKEVYLFGADFSYPSGIPYAKATYLFPYFMSKSNRTESPEMLFWKFITDSKPEKTEENGVWKYRTKQMDYYRTSLEKLIEKSDFTTYSDNLNIIKISGKHKKETGRDNITKLLSSGRESVDWKTFLKEYYKRLKSLPPLNGPPQDYLSALKPEDRQAWATLLPTAATFRKETGNGPEAVEKARLWTLKKISGFPIE